MKEYESWVARYGEPDPSIPTFLSIAIQETAIRKADEQQREAERERLGRDYDSRREEKRREDRRPRAESPWTERPEEVRRKEQMPSTSEAGRYDRSRDVDEEQYNMHAEQLRREEDARVQDSERNRRRVEEKRHYEQDGILRRQAEADAAARAVRQDIAHRTSPAPPAMVGRLAQDTSGRASPGSPPARHMPVAAPHPARPPNSSQLTDLRQAPSIMSLESPTRYDYDSATDVEGKPAMPWRRKPSQDLTPTKKVGNGYVLESFPSWCLC